MLNYQKTQSEYAASNYTQLNDYRFGRHIGQGAYATVKLATHKLTGAVLAIKVYEKFRLVDLYKKKGVCKEINVLKRLNAHQNIIKLYDVIDTPK